jgi:cytochrome P450
MEEAVMSGTKPVPEVDYDHRDEQAHRDPCPRWRQLRDQSPVVHIEKYGGFYALTRYAEIAQAVRNWEVYSSAEGTGIPVLPGPRTPPLDVDPPEARRWRELVNPYFSPSRVAGYRPWMRELAQERVRDAMSGSSADVAQDIGIPLTRQVILTIMDVKNAPAELNAWTNDLIFGLDETAQHGGQQLWGFLRAEVTGRRARPGADLVSSLVAAQFGDSGRPLTDDEIVSLLLLVLIAALETTNGAISAMIAYLLQNPEAAQRLRDEPAIWPRAMDEFVRWSSPAVGLARTTVTDAVVAGCPIPTGEKVMFIYASGNRDEREFDRPDDVVLDRYPNRHLGFGMGPHRCLGSHLAKAQMELVLEAMLPLLPHWRLDPDNEPEWHAGSTRGMASLRLVRPPAGQL